MIDSSTGTARAPEGEPQRPRTEGAAPQSSSAASAATESLVVASRDPIAREWNPGLRGVEFSPISAEAIRTGRLSTVSSATHPWLPHMKTEFAPTWSTGQPVARRAGEKLRHVADYLRRDTRATWADWEQFLIDHPAESLAGALAAGFIFARLVRRR